LTNARLTCDNSFTTAAVLRDRTNTLPVYRILHSEDGMQKCKARENRDQFTVALKGVTIKFS
jgi:hypothetical protein